MIHLLLFLQHEEVNAHVACAHVNCVKLLNNGFRAPFFDFIIPGSGRWVMAIVGGMLSALPMTQVELSLACRNLEDRDVLSKSDPMIIAFMINRSTGEVKEIGRTERLMNTLNPHFARKITVDYHFEERQILKFEVYDIDSKSPELKDQDFLGQAQCAVGEIVGGPGAKIQKPLTNRLGDATGGQFGSIFVTAEQVPPFKEFIHLRFQAFNLDKKDAWSKSDPFLMIYRLNVDNTNTLAYRSEVISDNLNPVWKPFKVKLQHLCNSDPHRPIRIDCYDNDIGETHDFIGSAEVTVNELHNVGSCFDLVNPTRMKKRCCKCKAYKNSGVLKVMTSHVQIQHSFLEYIFGGTDLHFSVAVDFTGSNGNPRERQSLHYIDPFGAYNQYQLALKAVGEIIQDYNSDQNFPAFGFGAELPGTGVSHDFHLNFNSDPRCHGMEGVLGAYQHAMTVIDLSGPTMFSPVIKRCSQTAANSGCDGSHYFVLLIITDGIIRDMDETISSIVDASYYPISIIIVGVGGDSFEAMDELDSDDGPLSIGGKKALRDIVQFVPFRKFFKPQNPASTQMALAREVLYEIPDQLSEWMSFKGIAPKPPKQMNFTFPSPDLQASTPGTQHNGITPAGNLVMDAGLLHPSQKLHFSTTANGTDNVQMSFPICSQTQVDTETTQPSVHRLSPTLPERTPHSGSPDQPVTDINSGVSAPTLTPDPQSFPRQDPTQSSSLAPYPYEDLTQSSFALT